MLVLEGIMPFLYPARWRRLVASLATISDRHLRIMGFICMLIGASVLYIVR